VTTTAATATPRGPGEPEAQGSFATTHWSVVVAAGRSDTPRAQAALAKLCEAYWYPLYAFVRRSGYASPDAKDLTQEFFARMLEGHWLAQADQHRGRFRCFLLAAMKHVLANEWHKAHAQKRGGQWSFVSLDDDAAEHRYADEPITEATPERLFERRWALALLEGVLARLEAEYQREGKGVLFAALSGSLTAHRTALPYAELASRLGMGEGPVRVAVHRLRQRYRQLLREAVAQTVAFPEEIDAEMQHLFQVLLEA